MAARSARAAGSDAAGRHGRTRAWEAVPHLLAAFRRGLAEVGYVEGKNLAIETRTYNYRPELLAEAMRDVVHLKVNVIFAAEPEALAAASKGSRHWVQRIRFDPQMFCGRC